MNKILSFTCNNFFEVSFRDLLKNDYEVDFLRLDYDNSFINKEKHFIEQLKMAHDDLNYSDNPLYSRYDFPFDVELTKRIKTAFSINDYCSIFIDFKKLNSQSFLLLDFLRFECNIPIIIYLPKDLFSEENILKLVSYNVNAIITDFNHANILKTLNKYKTI